MNTEIHTLLPWTFNSLKAAARVSLPHGLVRKLWNLESSITNNFRGMLIPTEFIPLPEKFLSLSLSPPDSSCSLGGIKQKLSLQFAWPFPLQVIFSASLYKHSRSCEWQHILNCLSWGQSPLVGLLQRVWLTVSSLWSETLRTFYLTFAKILWGIWIWKTVFQPLSNVTDREYEVLNVQAGLKQILT